MVESDTQRLKGKRIFFCDFPPRQKITETNIQTSKCKEYLVTLEIVMPFTLMLPLKE